MTAIGALPSASPSLDGCPAIRFTGDQIVAAHHHLFWRTAMNTHKIVKVAFVAVALVLGAGLAKSSGLEASGYIVASSITGETTCQPGGSSDCGSELM